MRRELPVLWVSASMLVGMLLGSMGIVGSSKSRDVLPRIGVFRGKARRKVADIIQSQGFLHHGELMLLLEKDLEVAKAYNFDCESFEYVPLETDVELVTIRAHARGDILPALEGAAP